MANKQEKTTEAGRGTNNLIFDQTHLKSTQATTNVRASIWAGVVNFCEWYTQVAPGLLVVLVVNFALHAFLRDSYVPFMFWSGSLPAYGTYMCATIGTVFIMAAILIWNTFEACAKTWQDIPATFRDTRGYWCEVFPKSNTVKTTKLAKKTSKQM